MPDGQVETQLQGRTSVPAGVDVVLVGAGFAGMYLLKLMRDAGIEAVSLDAASGVGGTWYWNRYPGARVDIESMQYSMQFDKDLQQEWNWSERYAPQAELLRYANPHCRTAMICAAISGFNTRVASAHYDDAGKEWTLTTEAGETVKAPWCIMATGCLSAPNKTRFPGEEKFQGRKLRTSLWPHEEVRLRRREGCGDRHRLVSDPVHPDHCRAVRTIDGVPAHAELLRPGAQQADGSGVHGPHQGNLR